MPGKLVEKFKLSFGTIITTHISISNLWISKIMPFADKRDGIANAVYSTSYI